ncbi:MAG TPA: OmpA family protein [Pseudomonas sp.]|nr:OmpA family protein [Pseudomonas sp.]
MKYLFDLFKTYATTVLQITITVGVIVVFAYWAFIINFFPAGITLSESLLFIFAALMFGLFYSLWYLLAVSALHGLFHWRSDQIKFDGGLFFLGIVAASLLGAAAWASQSLKILAPLLGAMILLMIPWYWKPLPFYTPVAQVQKRQREKVLLALTAIIVPMLFVPDLTANIITNSMQRLGFRQMDVSVSLDAANQKIIKGVVEEFDLRLHSCGNRKTPEQIVHHVNVLWHGLGERTLIEMPFLTDSSSGSPYQVELNRSGVNLVRRPGNQAGIPLCFSLGNDLLFDTYASTLTPEGTAALTAFAKKVKTYLEDSKRLITAISVTGHSDRNPVRAANDSNQKLSRRRAESVAEQLKTLSPDLQLNIKAAGSHTPVSSCARNLPKTELSECLAMDRRVEIVVQSRAL